MANAKANGDFDQFRSKWMSKRRSHIATTEKCYHCVTYQARLKKIDGLRYRFPHTSAVNYSLAVCFLPHSFFSHLCFCSCILLLSFLFCYFICLFLLSLSHLCSYSLPGSAYQKKRKERTFRSPLLPFPKIPWEDWFNRCLLVRLTVTSKVRLPLYSSPLCFCHIPPLTAELCAISISV